MKQKHALELFLSIILTLSLAGCVDNSPSPTPEEIFSHEPISSYPVTLEESINSPYPIQDNNTIPGNRGPDFFLDRPVVGGDTIVKGTGPSGVPIRLIDVSELGKILGETLIESTGKFIFMLDQPLISGHSVGIQLGDITKTDLNKQDFLYNENYYERPFVGILFDMATVE